MFYNFSVFQKTFLVFVLCFFTCILYGCTEKSPVIIMESEAKESFSESFSENTDTQEESGVSKVFVYVCGCVADPGVYCFEAGARIYEAVEAAGGCTDEADLDKVNMAQIIEDQMKIYIPSVDESSDMAYDEAFYDEGKAQKININTASAAELDGLPGIGAAKAAEIIAYRNTHGKFSDIEQLMDIPGIKQGIFDKIKELITVN